MGPRPGSREPAPPHRSTSSMRPSSDHGRAFSTRHLCASFRLKLILGESLPTCWSRLAGGRLPPLVGEGESDAGLACPVWARERAPGLEKTSHHDLPRHAIGNQPFDQSQRPYIRVEQA